MEVGSLVMDAFYIVLGNPDVMVALITFMLVSTILLSTIELKGAN